ncbi:MAG: YbaK/EbsC family protein [Candidatus Methylomirabilales bacterium]
MGGTPPFGHRQTVPVLIDRGVSDLEEIYAGGGADDVMLRLKVADLLQATTARLLDVI